MVDAKTKLYSLQGDTAKMGLVGWPKTTIMAGLEQYNPPVKYYFSFFYLYNRGLMLNKYSKFWPTGRPSRIFRTA
ncbi:MAG: hypothetical protein JO099_19095 [Acidobacteriia bacterium]|nr:hypothetical protein [Terriglobia bacterium]